jgi:hypothetical protein
MDTDKLKDFIQDQLRVQIQSELLIKRAPRGYDGKVKYAGNRGALSDRVYRGTLFKSTKVEIVEDLETNGRFILEVSFPGAPEWYWVNYGRKGKRQNPALKYPPLNTILLWTKSRKGFTGFRGANGPMDDRTTAFLVQRSIGEYGTYKTDFIGQALIKTRNKLEKQVGDYAAAFFEELILKIKTDL